MRHLSTALCVLIVAGALIVSSPAFAAWDEDLVESATNPVFDPPSGGSVYYPTVLYDADGFGAVKKVLPFPSFPAHFGPKTGAPRYDPWKHA